MNFFKKIIQHLYDIIHRKNYLLEEKNDVVDEENIDNSIISSQNAETNPVSEDICVIEENEEELDNSLLLTNFTKKEFIEVYNNYKAGKINPKYLAFNDLVQIELMLMQENKLYEEKIERLKNETKNNQEKIEEYKNKITKLKATLANQ